MNSNRFDIIREASKKKLPLSPASAELLEALRSEDTDLGGVVAVGEILPPDDVRAEPSDEPDDEQHEDTRELSPSMRDVVRGSDNDGRKTEAYEEETA